MFNDENLYIPFSSVTEPTESNLYSHVIPISTIQQPQNFNISTQVNDSTLNTGLFSSLKFDIDSWDSHENLFNTRDPRVNHTIIHKSEHQLQYEKYAMQLVSGSDGSIMNISASAAGANKDQSYEALFRSNGDIIIGGDDWTKPIGVGTRENLGAVESGDYVSLSHAHIASQREVVCESIWDENITPSDFQPCVVDELEWGGKSVVESTTVDYIEIENARNLFGANNEAEGRIGEVRFKCVDDAKLNYMKIVSKYPFIKYYHGDGNSVHTPRFEKKNVVVTGNYKTVSAIKLGVKESSGSVIAKGKEKRIAEESVAGKNAIKI
ncbi:hypothetical protein HK098_000484 [Nowakowskiella sp. JEL0407]|nr:hypothetical protein HK098_000484 [Nowakowskiella sp. JEL0407]